MPEPLCLGERMEAVLVNTCSISSILRTRCVTALAGKSLRTSIAATKPSGSGNRCDAILHAAHSRWQELDTYDLRWGEE